MSKVYSEERLMKLFAVWCRRYKTGEDDFVEEVDLKTVDNTIYGKSVVEYLNKLDEEVE